MLYCRIVRDALGLPQRGEISAQRGDGARIDDPKAISVITDVVLEAEMVAFSDATARIDGLCQGHSSLQAKNTHVAVPQNSGESEVLLKAALSVCGDFVTLVDIQPRPEIPKMLCQ